MREVLQSLVATHSFRMTFWHMLQVVSYNYKLYDECYMFYVACYMFHVWYCVLVGGGWGIIGINLC